MKMLIIFILNQNACIFPLDKNVRKLSLLDENVNNFLLCKNINMYLLDVNVSNFLLNLNISMFLLD